MLEIDNSMSGNCMYYAYAIALMYHFKSLTAAQKAQQQEIFALTELSAGEQADLENILKKPEWHPLSEADRVCIETILGPKLRIAAAKASIQEFETKLGDSDLVASLSYEVIVQLKQYLIKQRSPLADLVEQPAKLPSLTEAEIYRVPGIHAAIKRWVEVIGPKFIAKNPTTTTVGDEFITKKVIEFLQRKQGKQLKKYYDRLAGNGNWATIETLSTLHAFITGEGMRKTKPDHSERFRARPIELIVYNGGRIVFDGAGNVPADIILDNRDNVHWLTLVTPKKELQILTQDSTRQLNAEAVLEINATIEDCLNQYIHTPKQIPQSSLNVNQRLAKERLVLEAVRLKDEFLSALLLIIQKERDCAIKAHPIYDQLVKFKNIFVLITSKDLTKDEKMAALTQYEEQARFNESFWGTFSKVIVAVLVPAVCIILGILVGALIGGIIGSAAGPGGSIVGAIWGALKGGNIAVVAGLSTGALVGVGGTVGLFSFWQDKGAAFVPHAKKAVQALDEEPQSDTMPSSLVLN